MPCSCGVLYHPYFNNTFFNSVTGHITILIQQSSGVVDSEDATYKIKTLTITSLAANDQGKIR